MDVNNPLSQEFLLNYPTEAARVLELLSPDNVVVLFSKLPTEVAAPVLAAMLPNIGATCLLGLDASSAVKLLNEMPVSSAARIYRLIGTEKLQPIFDHLSAKHRKRIRRILKYISLSAGDLMNPNVDMLPDDMTVADAIRRIERYQQPVKCEIYVVDASHRFLGVVELGKLLTSKHHVKLRDIMNRKLRPVSVNTSSDKLLLHPDWKSRQRLPVVESDNTLVGLLDYRRVLEIEGKESVTSLESRDNLLSLAGLYWVSLVQLLDSLLNITVQKKGEEK